MSIEIENLPPLPEEITGKVRVVYDKPKKGQWYLNVHWKKAEGNFSLARYPVIVEVTPLTISDLKNRLPVLAYSEDKEEFFNGELVQVVLDLCSPTFLVETKGGTRIPTKTIYKA